jgi:hypothetical protein
MLTALLWLALHAAGNSIAFESHYVAPKQHL